MREKDKTSLEDFKENQAEDIKRLNEISQEIWSFKVTEKMKAKQPLYGNTGKPKSKLVEPKGMGEDILTGAPKQGAFGKVNAMAKPKKATTAGTLNPKNYGFNLSFPDRPSDDKLDVGLKTLKMPQRTIYTKEIRDVLTELVGERFYQGNIHKNHLGHYMPRGERSDSRTLTT